MTVTWFMPNSYSNSFTGRYLHIEVFAPCAVVAAHGSWAGSRRSTPTGPKMFGCNSNRDGRSPLGGRWAPVAADGYVHTE